MRTDRLIRQLLCVAALLFAPWLHAALLDDFLAAVANGRSADVQAMLARGVDANVVDANGDPALAIAARAGNVSVVNALLASRADPNMRNRFGDTPLMLAALAGRLDVAKALRAAGGNVNPAGWTPLAYAAASGHDAFIRWLMKEGAAIDARSPNGTTALMMAAREGRYDTALLLVELGANVNLRNENNTSALDFARRNNDARLVEHLQRAGAH